MWIFEIFPIFWWKLLKSVIFRRNFHGILTELPEMLDHFPKSRKNCRNLQNFMKNWWNFANFGQNFRYPSIYLFIAEKWPLPPQGRSVCKAAAQVLAFVLLVGGSIGHWWGSRYNEMQQRTIWALRRQTEDLKKMVALRIRLKKWNERMKFGTNSGIFCLFPHFSGTFYEKLETFHHFLRISVKFWQNSTKISQKNDQIHRPKSEWNEISFHSGQKVWRFFAGILRC